MKSIARGRSPKKELAAARRHLADCPRCRAAVVAAAHGVEGPGDTVLLKRSGGAVSKVLKVVAVSASILATGAAWRYGTAPRAEPRDARTLALEPAASATGSTAAQPAQANGGAQSTTWQRSVTVQQLAGSAPAPEPAEPAPASEHLDVQPTVRVVSADAVEPPPAPTDTYWRALSEPVAAPPGKRPTRPAPSAARPSPHTGARPASPAPATAAAKDAKKADEYDFGIDELPPPKGRKSAIRTTLD